MRVARIHACVLIHYMHVCVCGSGMATLVKRSTSTQMIDDLGLHTLFLFFPLSLCLSFLFLSLRIRHHFTCVTAPDRQQTLPCSCNVVAILKCCLSLRAPLCPTLSLSLNLRHVISAAQPPRSSSSLPSPALLPHSSSCPTSDLI